MDQTRNYFLEEIKQNELMSREHEKVCTRFGLPYFSFFNCFCISISAIASLLSILIGIMSSAIWLKVCAITAGIKKYKSIIKKKKKKHDEIVLFTKSKLNTIKVLIFKPLTDAVY